MFDVLNGRLSIPARLNLIALCFAAPIALLLGLFINQVWKDVSFAQKELEGAAYLSQIWPKFVAAATDPVGRHAVIIDPSDRGFGSGQAARAFNLAQGAAGGDAGIALIGAVADGSNLTLDPDLDSFYAMDAATFALPRLMAATVAAPGQTGAVQLWRAQTYVDAAQASLASAMRNDTTGRARAALAGPANALAAAAKTFHDQLAASSGDGPQVPAARRAFQRAVDDIWRADAAELRRLLQARVDRLVRGLALNLALVAIAVVLAVLLVVTTTRALTGRLKGLLATMDRLIAQDVTVEVPFLSDRHESGHIAAALVAFKQSLIQARQAEQVLRESEARYRLLAENVTDVIVELNLRGEITFITPASERVLGWPPQDLVGRRSLDLIHPDDVRRVEAAIEAHVAAGPSAPAITLQYRTQRRDGAEVWIEGQPKVIFDAAGVAVSLLDAMRDITERKAAEQRQILMMHELNHRVKNTLATLQSIALQTLGAAETPAAFNKSFNARLLALSNSHDVLTRNDWTGACVREVIAGQLRPHQGLDGDRFELEGPETLVNAKAALALGMAFGELATNAAKFGALSVDRGMVSVRWERHIEAGAARLRLVWREQGGPRVSPRTRCGFGARLIERGLPHELGGATRLSFEPQGLVCEMDFPAEAVGE